MLMPRQQYSGELKVATMRGDRPIDSGKSAAEVARSGESQAAGDLESEWRAKGELAFPGQGAQPQARVDAERIAELERKIGQQTMEIEFLKKAFTAFQGASLGSRRQWQRRL